MATSFAILGSARINDDGLSAHLQQWAAAIGKPIKEVARQYGLKPLVKYAIELTPPGSDEAKGKQAQRAGEAAILIDLHRMGFTPVKIKGYRTISHVPTGNVKGRPVTKIAPVQVKTKGENPKFSDPEAFRKARLASKHSGRVTRGGKQGFYVALPKFNRMKKRAFSEVGRLASGWVDAARELGVPVPKWIARHGGGRGTRVQIVETKNTLTLRVVNHFPNGTNDLAAETERRLVKFRGYVRNGLQRQLKAKLSGAWGRRG